MDDDAGIAQARTLLRELHGHVADISHKLEAVEQRNRRAQLRGIPRRDPMAADLRRELYEVHRLIEGLHRRYPDTVASSRLQAANYSAAKVDHAHHAPRKAEHSYGLR